MLEGVLKVNKHLKSLAELTGFNPWYVGGGVKRIYASIIIKHQASFNPWYVGGGVKRRHK